MKGPLLEVRDLVKHFPARAGLRRSPSSPVHAVCGVSFVLDAGTTLGLVGESGCGKSTTGRLVLGLLPATSGSVHFDSGEVAPASRRLPPDFRRRAQMVFQDAAGALDHRLTVGASVAEPLKVHRKYGSGGAHRVAELLRLVELEPDDARRYPHELSGGQRQRVGIARALALEPDLIVLDEPVSSLDASIQAGVVNLLIELQERLGVAYLFISHDLSVIHHASDRVAVMYLGRFVEVGSRDDVFRRPAHPYTQALLSAVPSTDRSRSRRRIVLAGELPSAIDPPNGCRFRTRCWRAEERCATDDPELAERGQGHPVACHFAEVVDPALG